MYIRKIFLMTYIEFEEAVAQICPDINEWKYILPSVPVKFRDLFLYVLGNGYSIPAAYDCVLVSVHLEDKEFERVLKENKK